MGDVSLTAPDSWGWVKGGTLYWVPSTLIIPALLVRQVSMLAPQCRHRWLRSNLAGLLIILTTTMPGQAIRAMTVNMDIAVYGTYQASDKLSLNFRGEAKFECNLSSMALATLKSSRPPLQYNLWANVLSRIEFRWDHAESGRCLWCERYRITTTSCSQPTSFISSNLI